MLNPTAHPPRRPTRGPARRGSPLRAPLALVGLLGTWLLSPATLLAEPPVPTQLPTGEQLVGGQATVSRQGATMSIQQGTDRAALDWQGFDIGSQAHVDIRQPSSTSVLLNRIFGNDPSQIFGNLTANGQVYLANPHGFYFSPSASVNVGGLVATTHSLSLDDFFAGRDRFTRNGATGRIVNEGHLTAALGGYIALLAPEVRNQGVVIAELGTVALAAGDAYELHFDPARHLTSLRVERAQIQTLVDNQQAVLAPGGLIILSSQGMQAVQGSVVRHDGTLEASSLVSQGGRILLTGDAITLGSQAVLAATGATGGGEILVGGNWQGGGELPQATQVTMEQGARIDASATTNGDGGTVVLWSDVTNTNSTTDVHGSILARGGAQGGNGGQVEASGHQVDLTGIEVDAGASNGQGGLWLIDPFDYTITLLAAGNIVSTLNTGTSVTVSTSASILSFGGSLLSGAGDIFITNNIIPGPMANDATLTFKANRNIVISAGVTIDAMQNGNDKKLNLVLWSDQDSSGDGTIRIGDSLLGTTTIKTNGGGLSMSGQGTTTWTPYAGASPINVGTGYSSASNSSLYMVGVDLENTVIDTAGGNVQAFGESQVSLALGNLTYGVSFEDVQLSTGAGSIHLNGRTGSQSSLLTTFTAGTRLVGGSALSSTSGNLTIAGEVTSTSRANNAVGTWLGQNQWDLGLLPTPSGDVSLTTNSGNITITGTGTNAAGSGYRHGIALITSASGDDITISTASGDITLDGGANYTDASTTDTSGLQLQTGATSSVHRITSQTGAITLRGSNAQESSQLENAIRFTSGNTSGSIRIGYDGTTPYSGSILIEGNSILQGNENAGSGSLAIQSTGGLTIHSKDSTFTQLRAGASNPLTFDDDWDFGTTLGSFTLGKTTNTKDLTLSNALTVAGPITLYGGNLALNTPLTATGANSISLQGSGTITDGSNGYLVANALSLLGGTVFLDHSSNNIGTLAASGVSSLTYTNSQALRIGTVNTTGVTTTGPIRIETLTGDLTVAEGIATTDSSTSAIILNAGKSEAAGTSTGGNILITGSPTITTEGGGRTTLYSGDVSGSTGLTALIGSSSGRFRYNSDESTTNYTAALGTGSYAIYREQPLLTITANNQTMTYGTSAPTLSTSISAVNGDTSTQALTSTSIITIGGGTSSSGNLTAGAHTLTPSGATEQLGYAIGYSNGTLTVNPKAASFSGVTATDKVYDGTTSATLDLSGLIFSGLLLGDTVTASGLTGSFADKHVGLTKTVTLSGTTFGGADAGNYTLTPQVSTTATITSKNLTIDLHGQGSRVYDGTSGITLNGVASTLSGILGTDAVLVASGTVTGFFDKQAGTNKAVTYTGFDLSGADAGNYHLPSGSVTSTAAISPKPVSVSGLTAQDKIYDSTTLAIIDHSQLVFNGIIAGDSLTAAGTTGTFADANIGTDKPVSLANTRYGGIDLANYVVTNQVSATASILASSTRQLSAGLPQVVGGASQLARTGETMSGLPWTLPPHVTNTPPYLRFSDYVAVAAKELSTLIQARITRPSRKPTSAPSMPGTDGNRTHVPRSADAPRHEEFTLGNGILIKVNDLDKDTTTVTAAIPTKLLKQGTPISFMLPPSVIKKMGAIPKHFTHTNGRKLPSWLQYVSSHGGFLIATPAKARIPFTVRAIYKKHRLLVTLVPRSSPNSSTPTRPRDRKARPSKPDRKVGPNTPKEQTTPH